MWELDELILHLCNLDSDAIVGIDLEDAIQDKYGQFLDGDSFEKIVKDLLRLTIPQPGILTGTMAHVFVAPDGEDQDGQQLYRALLKLNA